MKQHLTSIFSSKLSLDLESQFPQYACVVVLLKGTSTENLEIAFIQRADSPTDRWSRHIAFPGGRRESFDQTALEAALRETREEIGVELRADELLGRLNDIQARRSGAHLDFFIRPFVFFLDRELSIVMDPSEVADFFWTPLSMIQDQNRLTLYHVSHEDKEISLPAVNLDREIPLWGLTYSMVLELIELFKFNRL